MSMCLTRKNRVLFLGRMNTGESMPGKVTNRYVSFTPEDEKTLKNLKRILEAELRVSLSITSVIRHCMAKTEKQYKATN